MSREELSDLAVGVRVGTHQLVAGRAVNMQVDKSGRENVAGKIRTKSKESPSEPRGPTASIRPSPINTDPSEIDWVGVRTAPAFISVRTVFLAGILR